MLGRWLLHTRSRGVFQGLSCAFSQEAGAALQHACVTSYTAHWVMSDCEVRSARGAALLLLEDADMTLEACNVGGVGEGGDDMATDVVVARHAAAATLRSCRLEDSGDVDARPLRGVRSGGGLIDPGRLSVLGGGGGGGRRRRAAEVPPIAGGVQAWHSARVVVERCHARNNDVTLTLSHAACIQVAGSQLRAGEFAVARALGCGEGSLLALEGCEVSGELWVDLGRPASFASDAQHPREQRFPTLRADGLALGALFAPRTNDPARPRGRPPGGGAGGRRGRTGVSARTQALLEAERRRLAMGSGFVPLADLVGPAGRVEGGDPRDEADASEALSRWESVSLAAEPAAGSRPAETGAGGAGGGADGADGGLPAAIREQLGSAGADAVRERGMGAGDEMQDSEAEGGEEGGDKAGSEAGSVDSEEEADQEELVIPPPAPPPQELPVAGAGAE